MLIVLAYAKKLAISVCQENESKINLKMTPLAAPIADEISFEWNIDKIKENQYSAIILAHCLNPITLFCHERVTFKMLRFCENQMVKLLNMDANGVHLLVTSLANLMLLTFHIIYTISGTTAESVYYIKNGDDLSLLEILKYMKCSKLLIIIKFENMKNNKEEEQHVKCTDPDSLSSPVHLFEIIFAHQTRWNK